MAKCTAIYRVEQNPKVTNCKFEIELCNLCLYLAIVHVNDSIQLNAINVWSGAEEFQNHNYPYISSFIYWL